MADAFNVIFSSFFTFAGTVILIMVVFEGISRVIEALRGE